MQQNNQSNDIPLQYFSSLSNNNNKEDTFNANGWVGKMNMARINRRHQNQNTKRMINSFKMKGMKKKILPSVTDINIIDSYSRVIFPALFLLFNLGYWTFYLIQSHQKIYSMQ